jgi:hypothetical protein
MHISTPIEVELDVPTVEKDHSSVAHTSYQFHLQV